jgi:hypothetical protein
MHRAFSGYPDRRITMAQATETLAVPRVGVGDVTGFSDVHALWGEFNAWQAIDGPVEPK